MNVNYLKPGQSPLGVLNTPEENKDEFRWATYVPGRVPQLKRHRTRGFAKAALTNSFGEKQGYELQGDEWVDVTEQFLRESEERALKIQQERDAERNSYRCPTCGHII